MYGDEVGAVVLDLGSTYTRCGFAGEDTPKAVFPTAVGVTYGDRDSKKVGASLAAVGDGDTGMKLSASAANATPLTGSGGATSAAAAAAASNKMQIDSKSETKTAAAAATASSSGGKRNYFIGERTYNYYRDGQDIIRPVQNGLINDWDAAEGLLDYSFRKWLQIDTKDHPWLVCESTWNTVDRRSHFAQLAFEKFDAPALFFCKNAVAASFSVGRPTSLVLDVAGGTSSAVPVHDGYVLHKGVKKSKIGADQLDEWLMAEFQRAQKSIVPRYKFKREAVANGDFRTVPLTLPHTTRSYDHHMTLELVRDIKETLCRVSENPFDTEANKSIPGTQYEMPDGSILDVGVERFSVPEKLFAPEQADLKNDFDYGFRGLHHMVMSSIESVDVDIRRDLYHGLVITGGGSLLNGLPARLQKELNKLSLKVKAVAQNSKNERKFGSWIGGSILASLGSFHQMWYSRSEYDEHGASLLFRKCP